ncbi:hypothetical protein [Antarcticirhabdus aurantiaca]|uniref:Uncharacterized protein n=1 Tax=Antarcticirhabdus aurantiaca TaxID=2606717 RepID=A0ACD4NHZ9_9HYPH|nr:hypothetical protein [Antarcticirhabdus aurantiaca]WAJ26420.1 hypothetical protein OXU80_16130 [Jeongeuplla avenae]
MSADPLPEHALAKVRARIAAAPQKPRRGQRAKPAPSAPPSRASLVTDFLEICRLDPLVESVRPAEPAFFGDVEHVADFEVVREGEPMLVEVVTDADLPRHPYRAVLLGEPLYAEDGRRFLIETAATLQAEPRHTTVKLVMQCRVPVSAGDRVRILHHLDETGTSTLVECASVVQNSRDGVAAVLALAVEGFVSVEVDGPILPETRVRRRRSALLD